MRISYVNGLNLNTNNMITLYCTTYPVIGKTNSSQFEPNTWGATKETNGINGHLQKIWLDKEDLTKFLTKEPIGVNTTNYKWNLPENWTDKDFDVLNNTNNNG